MLLLPWQLGPQSSSPLPQGSAETSVRLPPLLAHARTVSPAFGARAGHREGWGTGLIPGSGVLPRAESWSWPLLAATLTGSEGPAQLVCAPLKQPFLQQAQPAGRGLLAGAAAGSAQGTVRERSGQRNLAGPREASRVALPRRN